MPPGPIGPPDHYAVLGVPRTASADELKAAYRALAKRHHPDAGGDEQRILALNAAWEVLGDKEHRARYDARLRSLQSIPPDPAASSGETARRRAPADGSIRDQQLAAWLQQVYAPIDRLLGQVINPFPAQLKALSADPYDDNLMQAFCDFLDQCQTKMGKVETIYRGMECPAAAHSFALSLYQCLAQVQDSLMELERYTMGYVDSYLRDGQEMLRQAKRRRASLHEARRQLVC